VQTLEVRLCSEVYTAVEEAAKQCQLEPPKVIVEIVECWLSARRRTAEEGPEPRSPMKSCSSPGFVGHVPTRNGGHKASV
jgi:hypothetical protein